MDLKNVKEVFENPEKYIFGFKNMSETAQKEYEEGFYSYHPKPNTEFDSNGLRYDINYLDTWGSNIIICPVEFMANYVDANVKNLVDTNDDYFIKVIIEDGYKEYDESNFPQLNATAIGNFAYTYLNLKDETAKEIIKNMILKIFNWKLKQCNAELKKVSGCIDEALNEKEN